MFRSRMAAVKSGPRCRSWHPGGLALCAPVPGSSSNTALRLSSRARAEFSTISDFGGRKSGSEPLASATSAIFPFSLVCIDLDPPSSSFYSLALEVSL